jgi:ribulose-5-phosphate 4-epimerase/fuculose-1-phosphate aldolase
MERAWRTVTHPGARTFFEETPLNLLATPDNPVRDRVSPEEWQVRVDLAALYRLVALFGWDDLIFTHITAKVPGADEHFLINPYGMMFEEITASSLVKIDLGGNKVMESEYDINPAGFTIHSCIHAARKDAMCVLHTHSINGVAVSAQKEGLLPLSQFAFIAMQSLSYHEYEGLALNPEEQPRLVRDLGDTNYMILRNHGLLTVGRSMAEAFQAMHRLEAACMVQVRAQAGGGELSVIPPEVMERAKIESIEDRAHKARLAWAGLLRRLDRRFPGYAD